MLANKKGTRNEISMYYNIVKSGERIQNMRMATGISRISLAEHIGISVEALRKIEKGKNGGKIDTLVILADYFSVSLDYLICGCEEGNVMERELDGLKESELLFVHNVVKCMTKDIQLLR